MTPDIDRLRELVIGELLATPKDRRLSSPDHPEAQARGDEFYSEHVSTIVHDVLVSQGLHRIDGLEPNRRAVTYGHVAEDGSPTYVRITWRIAADTFSPHRDINLVEPVLFGPEVVA